MKKTAKRSEHIFRSIPFVSRGFEIKSSLDQASVIKFLEDFPSQPSTWYRTEINAESFPVSFMIRMGDTKQTDAVALGEIIEVEAMRLTILRGRVYPSTGAVILFFISPLVLITLADLFAALQTVTNDTAMGIFLIIFLSVGVVYGLSRPFFSTRQLYNTITTQFPET